MQDSHDMIMGSTCMTIKLEIINTRGCNALATWADVQLTNVLYFNAPENQILDQSVKQVKRILMLC